MSVYKDYGFMVTVTTSELIHAVSYAETAGALVNAMHAALGDPHMFRLVVRGGEMKAATVEVDVSTTGTLTRDVMSSPIVVHAIVQVCCVDKATFDKNVFSTTIRQQLPELPIKITKRSMTKEDMVLDDELPLPPLAEEPA